MTPWPPETRHALAVAERPAHGIGDQQGVLELLVAREAAVEVGDEPDELAAARVLAHGDRRRGRCAARASRRSRADRSGSRGMKVASTSTPASTRDHRQVAAEGHRVGLLEPGEDRVALAVRGGRGGVVRAVDAGAQLRREAQVGVPGVGLDVVVERVAGAALARAAVDAEQVRQREIGARVAVLAEAAGLAGGDHRAARARRTPRPPATWASRQRRRCSAGSAR